MDDQDAGHTITVLPTPLPTPRLPAPAPELCVIVPVLNERDNIAPLVILLRAALDGVAWEVVFVDDGSTDGTRAAVAALGHGDNRVRLLYRARRRGLASAFVEGAECSLSSYIAAMDGDLQHDETLLPRMLAVLRSKSADVVVGSRYVVGGDLGTWNRTRASMSGFATRLGRVVIRADVSDPMSGFFMLPRTVFDSALPRLSAIGFKILLDILSSLPEPPRIRELPYSFRERIAGTSKLDAGVLFDFAMLLMDKLVGHLVPVRFTMFAIIGIVGLVAHLIILRLGLKVGLSFEGAQGIATGCAVVANFILNNLITFRDRRLKDARLWRGLLTFSAVCAIGAVANLNIAALMVSAGHQTWWAAGVIGAAMSLVWNYAVGSTLTWRR